MHTGRISTVPAWAQWHPAQPPAHAPRADKHGCTLLCQPPCDAVADACRRRGHERNLAARAANAGQRMHVQRPRPHGGPKLAQARPRASVNPPFPEDACIGGPCCKLRCANLRRRLHCGDTGGVFDTFGLFNWDLSVCGVLHAHRYLLTRPCAPRPHQHPPCCRSAWPLIGPITPH